MGMSIQEIFESKFKEIQSRLPVKMNRPDEAGTSFQDILNNVSYSAGTSSSSGTSNSKYMPQIDSAIQIAASKYKVDPNFVKAIIKAESGFNPNAVSGAGAQGLMQLMPSTARGLGVTNSFDIQQNVDAGTRYIKEKLDQFGGDPRLALAAYNAGPGNVQKYRGIPPFPETQNYVRTVMGYYQSFSK